MADYVCLFVPLPPSVNNLFAGKGRRFRAQAYKDWSEDAIRALNHQRPLPVFRGPYSLTMTFGRPDKRRRDLGNLEKAPHDLLCEMGVVEDDCLAERIVLQWGDVVGCRIEVFSQVALMERRVEAARACA